MAKVDSAEVALKALNPEVNVVNYTSGSAPPTCST